MIGQGPWNPRGDWSGGDDSDWRLAGCNGAAGSKLGRRAWADWGVGKGVGGGGGGDTANPPPPPPPTNLPMGGL